MDIVRTGIGLTKTIKNVTRLREILNVFWRNGFDEFIIKTNLHSKIPGFVLPKKRIQAALESREDETEADVWHSIGYRLRKSFEELGPSFIKLGQLMASREDLLDPALIKELKLLQNKVQGISFTEAKEIVERNLDKPFDDVFESFGESPIGTASIGIAYKAKLKTGEDVVVKVRRPNIKHLITTDFEIIAFIVSQIDKVSNDFKYMGASRAIDDFFKSIQVELNFLIEAQNCKKLKTNLEKIDKDNLFVLPQVYKEFSSEEVLVMEFLDGRPFNEVGDLAKEDPDLEPKLQKSVRMFTHTILADGFFHADLHGGNFFLMPDGKIGLIDFGLMGSLSKKNRTNLVAILLALVTNNYENLVFEFLDVADYETIPNHEVLTRDIQDALSPYIGLSVQETDVTQLVHTIVTTLSKHQMYLPREWFIIFRALMTLDGLGKSIHIDLNIFEVIDEEIHGIMGELVSKESMMEDALWLGRDTLNSVRIIPRHIRWLLKEFAKRKYRLDIEIGGIQREIKLISKSIYFIGLMFLASTLVFSGVFLVKDIRIQAYEDVPAIAWVFWSIATVTMFRASAFIRNK
jgi:ubiquinone biosynthesis protein